MDRSGPPRRMPDIHVEHPVVEEHGRPESSLAPPKLPAPKMSAPPPISDRFESRYTSFGPIGGPQRGQDRARMQEWLTKGDRTHLVINDPTRRESDHDLGRARFSDKKEQSSAMTLARLAKHLELDPNMTVDQVKTLQDVADRVHSSRSGWSKFVDRLGIFGKSAATIEHAKLTDKIQNLPTQRATREVARIEKAFGSGVKLTDGQKESLTKFFLQFPTGEALQHLDLITRVMDNPRARTGRLSVIAEPQVELVPIAELLRSEGKISDDDLKTLRQIFNALPEQFFPENFNTQYRAEYLPKNFVPESERSSDHILRREQGSLRMFNTFMGGLPENDPRKVAYNEQLQDAIREGFTPGEDMSAHFGGGGTLPDVSVVRYYGVQRTEGGFRSILGLSQGDRRAIGTDFMPWPHETTQKENAAIMNILREVEGTEKLENRQSEFESAFAKHGTDLSPGIKDELKKSILAFAAQRDQRVDQQLRQVLKRT